MGSRKKGPASHLATPLGRTIVVGMKTLTAEWTQEIDRRRESLVALRRDFHRHPELSFEERRTAEIIAGRLHAAKLEVRTGLGRTGVVGVLHGDRPGRAIAWRADIDALPLTETFEAPFTSSTPGVMHACGHDGHAAIALTLAEILSARRRELPGTAVFIFQPAEEVFGGAAPTRTCPSTRSPPPPTSCSGCRTSSPARWPRTSRPCSPWARSSAAPSTTSSRPARSCAARCARSARRCAGRSRGGWPTTPPTSRAPTAPRRG